MFGIFYLQSEYSLLNNLIPLNKLISLAKEGGYDFVALSDNNNLYGMYEFFKLAKANDLKPIIGMKIEVNYGVNKTGFLIYVKNEIGYKNLLKVSSIINIENRNLDYDELINLQEGLIVITSGLDCLISKALENSDFDQANQMISRFKNDIDNFYIGLMLSKFDYEIKVAPALVSVAIENEVLILPIQKTSYIDDGDKDNYSLLKSMENQTNQDFDEGDLSFLTKEQLEYRFLDYQFVFNTASEVANLITFDLIFPKFELPDIDTEGKTSDLYLKQLAFKGLEERLRNTNLSNVDIYHNRLEFELDVIIKLGYANYFLIVSDFVIYAKNNDVLVGPGRGSGAGSLVAYCLYITEVDPIKYDLLFERFLNPARISMPDIDLDFPDDKRDFVIDYVYQKYGKDNMASIITFDTFQFNSSIRDLARVKKFSVAQTNQLLEDLRKGTTDMTNDNIREVVDASNAIIGLPRHTGTHPAGIILSSQNLKDIIPLQKGPNQFNQTQWNMNHLEEIGLLKIDFLGLKNLTIIDETKKLIQQSNPNFSLDNINYDNDKTYFLLQDGDTNGVFQLEQPGMQATLRKVSPTKFEDLVAILALYRPGPMANIDIYARRLKGEAYEPVNPVIDEILKPTYGVIIYQEQIMQIANQFAGYSYAEADLLRRSISKKDLITLQEEENHFIQSAVKNGRDPLLSKEIYDYIVKFADYGFNRAHSVSYAILSYQMAYMKANHFQEFASVLLSNNIGNEQLTQKYLQELRNNGYEILPPDVNIATSRYQVLGNAVMLPITLVKSIGRETANKFLAVRNETPFTDFTDFKTRTSKTFSELNWENLIYSGALDEFGTKKTLKNNSSKDDLIYSGYLSDVIIDQSTEEYPIEELVLYERQAYGFNIFQSEFKGLEELRENNQASLVGNARQQKQSRILAKVVNVKEITTKRNEKMAFLTIKDEFSELDVTAFPALYKTYLNFEKEEFLLFAVEKNVYNERDTFVIKNINKIKK